MIAIIVLLAMNTIGSNLRLEKTKSQIYALETYIESNKDLLTVQDHVNHLKATIEKAMGKAPNWAEILIYTGEAKPNDIIIDIIKGTYNDSKTIITINGRAYSQESLVYYIKMLDDLEIIQDVKCNYARQSSADNDTSLEFEILIFPHEGQQFQLEDI